MRRSRINTSANRPGTESGGSPFASSDDPFWRERDEAACIAYVKQLRWRDGAYCPYCGHFKIYNLDKTRLPFCGNCKNTFSVKVGTIFHGSRLPMAKWFAAIQLVSNPQKGVTCGHLARELQVGETTAWHILRRLRHAAGTASFNRAKGEPGGLTYRRRRTIVKGGRTYAPSFLLEMPVEEALARFIGVEREELLMSLATPARKRAPRVPRARPMAGGQASR